MGNEQREKSYCPITGCASSAKSLYPDLPRIPNSSKNNQYRIEQYLICMLERKIAKNLLFSQAFKQEGVAYAKYPAKYPARNA
jgi:hypothetical protein